MDKPYSIKDLVDIDRLKTLFENFSKATGFVTAFLSYPDQELLLTTGWREICTRFHRACPESARCCKQSDLCLTGTSTKLKEQSIHQCANGLVDGATPVIIDGQHLASIATGQVLLAQPDLRFFKKRAAKFGFDPEEYLAALAKVPIITQEQLTGVLSFLGELAVQIAEEGLSRLKSEAKAKDLHESKQEVERQVEERTAELQAANAEISKSEASLRALSNNIPNGITYQMIYSDDGSSSLAYVSSGIERIYGLPVDHALSDVNLLYAALHPEDASRVMRQARESALALRSSNIEGRIKTQQGEIRWVQWSSTPRRLKNGTTICDGIAIDVTEKKQAEQALNRAHRTLQVLKECDTVLVRATQESELLDEICRILMDIWGARITWVGFARNDETKSVSVVAHAGADEGYLKLLQVSWADELRGRGPTGTAIRTGQVQICRNIGTDPCFEPWREEALKRGYTSMIALPLVSENHSLGALMLYSVQSDAFNPEEVELLMQLAGDLTYGIISIRNREERRRLQNALLSISEREKQHIAQELHDGICQHLAGTALTSKLMEKQLTAKEAPEAEYAKRIRELLTTGLEEVRNLSHGLHPVRDEPNGLIHALAQLAQTITKLFCIRCEFRSQPHVSLDNSLTATHLFRIAQESVNNAIKHGEASRVWISLDQKNNEIILSIRDNGVGIQPSSQASGMGMQIMKHRASVIGAALAIHKTGRRGTLVSCTLPLPGET